MPSPDRAATALAPPVGRSALTWRDPGQPRRPIVVHCYRPDAHRPTDPVVIVQHGMMRNGDEYRDFWVEAADRHRLLIAAPTFDDKSFPKVDGYNNGMVIGADGAVAPRARWTYGAPARIFAALRAGGVTRVKQAHLFGHSAGGQFVHRLMATQGHAAFKAAAPANSGWYTLPTLTRPFPEGLGGLRLSVASLARYFAYPMTILAGDQDIDPDDPHLQRHAAAAAQGPHRLARARFHFDFARREARRLGLPFAWRLVVVKGVAHDGKTMSRAAAALWFEGRVPSPRELLGGSGRSL